MENQENKKQKTSDEVDFSQIFNWIAGVFNSIARSFVRLLAEARLSLIKHGKLLTVLIIATQVVSLVYFKILEKRYYRTTFKVSSAFFSRKFIETEFDNLNFLVKDKERQSLAEVLRIDLPLAKNIHEFDATPFITETEFLKQELLKEQLRSITVDDKLPNKVEIVGNIINQVKSENLYTWEINIRVYDPNSGKQIAKAVYDYLRDFPYIKNRISIDSINLQGRKKKLISQSIKLDSLKRIVFTNFENMGKQTRDGSNNVILTDKYITNPLDVLKEDLLVSKEILEVEKNLYLQPEYELINDFTVYKVPDNPKISFVSPVALLVTIVIFFGVVLLINLNRYLSKVEID